MGDVAAVVAITFHDESLRPEQLLCRNDLDLHVQNFAGHSMLKPSVIDRAKTVARIEYHIDAPIILDSLPEPMAKPPLGLKTGVTETLHEQHPVRWTDKEVEILRASPDHSRVYFQPERPTDQKWNAGVSETGQCLPINVMGRIFVNSMCLHSPPFKKQASREQTADHGIGWRGARKSVFVTAARPR